MTCDIFLSFISKWYFEVTENIIMCSEIETKKIHTRIFGQCKKQKFSIADMCVLCVSFH